MNARLFTLFSVLLNLALMAGIIGALRRPSPMIQAPIDVARIEPKPMAPPVEAIPAPVPGPEPQVENFEWVQVADKDFKKYRDQLLAIGCPESTMRVIVMAEINELYGSRRRAALAMVQAQFWDLIGQGGLRRLETMTTEACGEIRQERRRVIDDVLGNAEPDPEELAANQERAMAARRLSYSWLPDDKRDAMIALDQALEEAANEIRRKARENNNDRQANADAKARQKELEQQIRSARQGLLTPEEFSEWELRSSGAANWALNATGFEPTEDEWRQVTRLQKQRDDALAQMDDNRPANAAEKRARTDTVQMLNDQLMRARDAALGPERAAEYARATDRDYRQVRAVLQKYGLDDALAREVYEFQQIAMKQAAVLRANSSLSPYSREAALSAIGQETERMLAQTMGAKAYQTYRKHDEGWFVRLRGPSQ